MQKAGFLTTRLICAFISSTVYGQFQVDLKDIGAAYLQKYHVGLSKDIHDDTSGDYRKLLVRLTNMGY